MAFTVSHLMSTVMGDQRVISLRLTADGAEDNTSTGLAVLHSWHVGLQSATTAAIKFAMNENSSGAASMGNIGVSGAANGDELVLTVYGR